MSTSTESLAQKWLRQNVQAYAFKMRTQLLLCLHGLLPIAYHYPRQPPITYVVPTSDMLVRSGKYVDVSGRCNIEYLQNWEKKSEQHFSRDPPVYAKPKTASNQQSQPQSELQHPGKEFTCALPPYNVVHDRGLSSGVSVTGSSATFNTQSHAMSPSYTPGRTMSSEIEQNRTSIPPYSPPSSTPVTASPTRPPPPPPPRLASLPLSPPPAPPLPVNPNQSISPQATGPISTQTSYSVHHGLPAPVPTAYSPANVPASIPRPTPSIPPPDLLDAEDDLSAPSFLRFQPLRHPAHQTLSCFAYTTRPRQALIRACSLRQAMALDAERLRANQTDLLAGDRPFGMRWRRCRRRMKTVVEQATSNVADLKRRGDPSVDELVCSTTIVHDQLINLVAEDNAIEDTIYHLHRALNAGRIDLERFLRTTRILAEEQFMKRALIEKIQGGIPMGTESSLHVRPEWA
ncbi:Vps23 core domain-containing protein [Irpex lacteus]|nr:Vps23 core domain-containing protein [Irpex lacteus]